MADLFSIINTLQNLVKAYITTTSDKSNSLSTEDATQK